MLCQVFVNNEPSAVLTLEDNVFLTSGVAVEAVNGVRVCIAGSTIEAKQCNPSRGSSTVIRSSSTVIKYRCGTTLEKSVDM